MNRDVNTVKEIESKIIETLYTSCRESPFLFDLQSIKISTNRKSNQEIKYLDWIFISYKFSVHFISIKNRVFHNDIVHCSDGV